MVEHLAQIFCCGPFNRFPETASNILREIFREDRNETVRQYQLVRCLSCSDKVRVENVDQIEPGCHICVGGEHSRKSKGGYQFSMYTHHAIVTDKEKLSESTVILTLVHFINTPFSNTLQIRETKELKNLLYDEIYLIKYHCKTHSSEKIIDRAKSQLNKYYGYSLLSVNCEHFCHWCCCGIQRSYQVQELNNVVTSVLRFLNLSAEDILGYLNIADPWKVLIFTSILFLIDVWFCYKTLCLEKQNDTICQSCFRQKKWNLVISFVTFLVSQSGGIQLLGSQQFGFLGILVFHTLSFWVLYKGIPKLWPKSRNINSYATSAISDLRIGDVISFADGAHRQEDGIVTQISQENGTFGVIYYRREGFFTGCIVEERIGYHESIKKYDFSFYSTYSREEAVSRARQRLGERKYSMISNRSTDFCFWAKVIEQEKTDTATVDEKNFAYVRKVVPGEDLSYLKDKTIICDQRRRWFSTKVVRHTWARIKDDIKPGMVIQFWQNMYWHSVVVTDVSSDSNNPSIVEITMVHYGNNQTVVEETITFDLKIQDIWMYHYHPLYCFQTEDVIRRARAKIGERKYNLFTNRSSQLAHEIVHKPVHEKVQSVTELEVGDIISFTYWGLPHDGVVITVPTGNGRAVFSIVHYCLDSIFDTRTVKEDRIQADKLQRSNVYRKNFDGYVVYPPHQVAARALARVGEQRFIMPLPIYTFTNTSWDLAHWAKVVQVPSILTLGDRSPRNMSSLYLLLPKCGQVKDLFQIIPVYIWKDIEVGSLLELENKLVMVVEIHYSTSSVIVIGCNTSKVLTQWCTGVCLRQYQVLKYIPDPRRTKGLQQMIESVRNRLNTIIEIDEHSFFKAMIFKF